MSSDECTIEDKDWSCCWEAYTDWYSCPNCKKDMIMVGASYCQDCGVKITWNLGVDKQELEWVKQELNDARRLLYLIIQKYGEICIYDRDLAMVKHLDCPIESIDDRDNRRYIFRIGNERD